MTLAPHWRAFLTLVWRAGAVLVALYVGFPELVPSRAHEGGVVENLSAVFFLFAALVGFWRCGRADVAVRWGYGAIPVLGLLAFGDEISDGIFAEPLVASHGVRVTSLHDLAHLAFNAWRDLPEPALRLGLAAGVVAAAFVVAYRLRGPLRAFATGLGREPAWQMVATSVGLAAIALVMDRDPGDTWTFWEEWFELNASVAMFFAAALIPLPGRPVGWPELPHSRPFRIAFWVCLVLATLFGLVMV